MVFLYRAAARRAMLRCPPLFSTLHEFRVMPFRVMPYMFFK